jgi:hypothetical protein
MTGWLIISSSGRTLAHGTDSALYATVQTNEQKTDCSLVLLVLILGLDLLLLLGGWLRFRRGWWNWPLNISAFLLLLRQAKPMGRHVNQDSLRPLGGERARHL